MTLSKSKSPEVQQRIVKGARTHFMAHGFRGVTMSELATELGMSKKTLYAYFPSKEALLHEMLADKFGDVEAELSVLSADTRGEFPERLHALLACIRRHTDEIQPAFLRDVAREAPELFEKVRVHRRAIIHRYFSSMLREGQAAGMIRSDVPEKLLIEFLIGVADAVVNPMKLAELGLTVHAAFTEIIIVFLEGAMTEKGRMKL
jgi:AcrR family transcriptional regulator